MAFLPLSGLIRDFVPLSMGDKELVWLSLELGGVQHHLNPAYPSSVHRKVIRKCNMILVQWLPSYSGDKTMVLPQEEGGGAGELDQHGQPYVG